MLRYFFALISFLSAFFGVPWILYRIPFSLRSYSPVVGFPLFADFDINRSFLLGYLQFLLVPVFTCLFFYVLCRLFQPSYSAPPPVPEFLSGENPFANAKKWAIGGTLGCLFFYKNWTPLWFLILAGAGLYSFFQSSLSKILASRFSGRSEAWFGSVVNLVCLPLCIWVLFVFSEQTGEFIDGRFHSVHWFNFKWGIFLFSVAVSYCGTQLFSFSSGWKRPALVAEGIFVRETRAVVALLTVVGLWALDARFPIKPRMEVDYFHWGERFVPSLLFLEGKIPWKDFLFVHGFLEDILQYALGLFAWGKNLRASWAGQSFWFHPLGLVAIAFFFWGFFHRNLFFISTLFLFLIFPFLHIDPNHTAFVPRFFLVPLSLLACRAFFQSVSLKAAAVFSGVAVLQIFLAAESFFLALGFAAATFLADLQEWKKGAGFKRNLKKTLLFGGLSLLWVGLGFLGLGSQGALTGFLSFHQATASGHRFTGGLGGSRIEPLWVAACFATLAATLYRAGRAWKSRRPLSPTELTLGAVFVFNVLYYQKYLSRADSGHFQVMWMPNLGLFLFCVYHVDNYPAGNISYNTSSILNIRLNQQRYCNIGFAPKG